MSHAAAALHSQQQLSMLDFLPTAYRQRPMSPQSRRSEMHTRVQKKSDTLPLIGSKELAQLDCHVQAWQHRRSVHSH